MCCSWTENGIFHTGPGRFPDCPPDRNHVPSDAVTPAARAAGLLQAVSSHLLQKLLSSGKQGERQGNNRVFRGAGMSGNKFNLYRKTRRPEINPDRPVAQSNAELTREGKGRSSSAPPSDWSRRMKSAENCLAPDSEAAEKLRRRNPSSPLQYDAAGSGRCSFEKNLSEGMFPGTPALRCGQRPAMHFSPGRQSGSGVDRECGTEVTVTGSSCNSRMQQNSSSPKSMSGLLLTVLFPPFPARLELFLPFPVL